MVDSKFTYSTIVQRCFDPRKSCHGGLLYWKWTLGECHCLWWPRRIDKVMDQVFGHMSSNDFTHNRNHINQDWLVKILGRHFLLNIWPPISSYSDSLWRVPEWGQIIATNFLRYIPATTSNLCIAIFLMTLVHCTLNVWFCRYKMTFQFRKSFVN